MPRVRIERGTREETLDVSRVGISIDDLRDGPPHQSFVLHGLDPSETDLLDAELTWLSGSMDDPRARAERDYQKFPLVFIPIQSEYTVTVIEHPAERGDG